MNKLPYKVIVYEDNEIFNFSPFDSHSTSYLMKIGVGSIREYYSVLFSQMDIEYLTFIEGENVKKEDISSLLYDEDGRKIDLIMLVPVGCIPDKDEVLNNVSLETLNGRALTFIKKGDFHKGKDRGRVTIQDLLNIRPKKIKAPEKSVVMHTLTDLINANKNAIHRLLVDHVHREYSMLGIQCVGSMFELYLNEYSVVYPNVIFDTTMGPIIIDKYVDIMPGSFIKGPCYIGTGTKIDGARINGNVSIFDNCNISGIIEDCIIHPRTNIEPFTVVKNAVIGCSVNIGSFCKLGSTSEIRDIWAEEYGNFEEKEDQDNAVIIDDFSRIYDHTIIPMRTKISFGSKISENHGFIPEFVPPFIDIVYEDDFDSCDVQEVIDYILDRLDFDSDLDEEEMEEGLDEEMEDKILDFFEQTKEMRNNFLEFYDTEDQDDE